MGHSVSRWEQKQIKNRKEPVKKEKEQSSLLGWRSSYSNYQEKIKKTTVIDVSLPFPNLNKIKQAFITL